LRREEECGWFTVNKPHGTESMPEILFASMPTNKLLVEDAEAVAKGRAGREGSIARCDLSIRSNCYTVSAFVLEFGN